MKAVTSHPSDSSEVEALEVVHHHPGRLRVRAVALRDDDVVAARVRAAMEGRPGVTRVFHQRRTGSILVEYEPGMAEPEGILTQLALAAGLALPAPAARPSVATSARFAIDATRELNAIAYELSGWRADLRTIVPAGLAAIAAYSFVKKKDRLPRWDNLLYWSYNVFVGLHQEEIRRSAHIAAATETAPPMEQ